MNKKRSIAFGYEMRNGCIELHEQESKIVKQIFSYAKENYTLQLIAEICNKSGVLYFNNNIAWSKHNVRRILENKCYYGNDEYLPIVTKEEFEEAYELRTGKASTIYNDIKLLRKYVICENCGDKIDIKPKFHKYIIFKCKKCKLVYLKVAGIDEVQNEVHSLILKVLANSGMLHGVEQKNSNSASLELIRAHQKLKSDLEKPQIDEDDIVNSIFKRAEEQYALCEMGKYNVFTLQLQEMSNKEHPVAFDKDLFISTVKNIIIDTQNKIKIKLTNGQIIE